MTTAQTFIEYGHYFLASLIICMVYKVVTYKAASKTKLNIANTIAMTLFLFVFGPKGFLISLAVYFASSYDNSTDAH